MKLYKVSLTITDEDNQEQLVSLQAPRLTGKQVVDLMTITTSGVILEPDPEIVTIPLPKPKAKKRKFLRRKETVIKPPEGFTPKDIADV